MAFCSAWTQMQASYPLPVGASEAQRGHPPSKQFRTPSGVPLYPVEMTALPTTMRAPTRLRLQFPREATARAIPM